MERGRRQRHRWYFTVDVSDLVRGVRSALGAARTRVR
jgi:hypothetical protein